MCLLHLCVPDTTKAALSEASFGMFPLQQQVAWLCVKVKLSDGVTGGVGAHQL